jgi:hypothetical protein
VLKICYHSRLPGHHIFGEGSIRSCNEKENLHFDDECNSHMSSEKYEENAYGDNLDLLIILH